MYPCPISTCSPTTVGGVWLSHSSQIPSLSISALHPVYAAENVVGVPIVGTAAASILDLTTGTVPYVTSTVFCGGVVAPAVNRIAYCVANLCEPAGVSGSVSVSVEASAFDFTIAVIEPDLVLSIILSEPELSIMNLSLANFTGSVAVGSAPRLGVNV